MSDEIQQELVKSLLKEKRKSRRWRTIRSFIWALIVLLYAGLIFGPGFSHKSPSGPYVALVRLNGPIMPGASFSAYQSLPAIKHAFKDKAAKGVILLINSPGGTAAQASIIHDRIMQLKKQYHKKVVVVAEDMLASGGYLVATAADKIFVNRDTLTGSIGVVLSGFGFVDAIHKLGITRRVFTAGTNKDRLDPFLTLTAQDKTKMDTLLKEVHQGFIQDVIQGRGKRLTGDHELLFSGDFWTGETAVKLGLADGTADVWTVMKTEFNAKYIKTYHIRQSILGSLLDGVGTELKSGLFKEESPLSAKAF